MKKVIQKADLIIKGLLILGLFYFSYLFQYIPVYLFRMDTSTLSGNYRMAALFSTFSSVVTLFIVLIIYRKDLLKDFEAYRSHFKDYFDIGFASWATGLVIMMISNFILSSVFHSAGANNENAVRELVHAFPLIMGIDICFVAPFLEEIVFRKTLKDVFTNKLLYIFLSFFLFGLAHVISHAETIVDWLYIVPYGVMGGVFAYADYKTDTIYTSIVFHVIHNTLLFILTLFL